MANIIFLTDMSEEYGRNILKGMTLHRKDKEPWFFHLLPAALRDTIGVEGILEIALKLNCDAIIGQFYNREQVEVFQRQGILVVAQDFKKRIDGVSTLSGLYYESGEMGAKYFLNRGYRNFAFYGIKDIVWSDERCNGFRQTVEREGKNHTFSMLLSSETNDLWRYNFDELISWIESLPKPVAIMACGDTQAYHIVQACTNHNSPNCKIPDDIALLGVDNDTTMCTLSTPNISSINQSVEKGGYDIADMIDRWLKSGSKNMPMESIIVDATHVVTRQSTDICACSRGEISSVLQYIRKNIGQKITVSHLVSLVPLSRRLLEIRFKDEVGKSIYEYIIHYRVSKICELLSDGHRISDVANELGFTDVKNMSRTFKQIKGMTPSEYQKSIQNL